jgi:hypothetical protein
MSPSRTFGGVTRYRWFESGSLQRRVRRNSDHDKAQVEVAVLIIELAARPPASYFRMAEVAVPRQMFEQILRHIARVRFISDELLGLFNRTAWPAAAAEPAPNISRSRARLTGLQR